MSLSPHVHCAECAREIAATVPVRGGKSEPAQIHAGQQVRLVMTPKGPAPVMASVPLCDACFEHIEAAGKPSRLVVPGRGPG